MLSHQPSLIRKPYFAESFIKTANEIIKFYSSVHRAYTYWQSDPDMNMLGDNRTHLKLTDRDFWNFNSPKISRKEFEEIIKNWDIYQEYAEYVLLKDARAITEPDLEDAESLNALYVEFVKNLEEDWLFHRSFYKLFFDVSEENTVLFIDLAAYCSTRHIRFLMKKVFGYLEGNYVTSLRREGKVYIPHIQFRNESVELLYSSYEGLDVENVIADYFIKENINSVDDILQKFERIVSLKVDVAKVEREHIFLNPSQYINRELYLEMYRKWIKKLGDMDIDFRDRKSIIAKVQIDELEIPEAMFIKDRYIEEDQYNYPSDYKVFFADPARAKKYLVRILFNDLLQYSINRYRFEERKGPIGVEERSEYENIFRRYKDMTFLEQDVNCLLVECGEISFMILMWRYIENPAVLDTIDKLIYWGLIEKEDDKYRFSPRAQRMAKWCMKLMGLRYQVGKNEIDFSDKPKIAKSYSNLVKHDGLFEWMTKVKNKAKLSQIFGEIIFPSKPTFAEKEITEQFKEMVKQFFDYQDDTTQKKVRESIEHSRFQKHINEFNRAYEPINRTAIAFPITTIPTEVERKIRTFSIFIGSFNLSDQLDSDDEDTFERGRRELTNLLNHAKIFYTLVGKPASESMSEAVIQSHARRHLESTLGRYQHKIKNEGVYLVALMDRLWEETKDKYEFSGIHRDMLEVKKGIERFSGTIHILNIATNGFQRKYLEELPYCILDVITEAYCNAFQQFYSAGRNEEVEKLLAPDRKSFHSPLLDIRIYLEENGHPQSSEKKISYTPEIKDIPLLASPEASVNITKYFDAEDIIGDKTVLARLNDKLPQKIIMQSPFFEIFTNAFTYMSKNLSDLKIDAVITKRADELTVEVKNRLDESFKIDKDTRERVAMSAGLAANELFFKSIGGSFLFKFDVVERKGIATARIVFSEMEHLMQLKEKTNGK